jgi:hypothetical protein
LRNDKKVFSECHVGESLRIVPYSANDYFRFAFGSSSNQSPDLQTADNPPVREGNRGDLKDSTRRARNRMTEWYYESSESGYSAHTFTWSGSRFGPNSKPIAMESY